MLVDLMVSELGSDNPVVLKIVQAAGIAHGNGATTAVDVSGILDPYAVLKGSTSGEKDGSCDCTVFIRGDANNDDSVNIADPSAILSYLFSGGDAPDPLDSGDANDDNGINLSDAIALLSYLNSGDKPPLPFGDYSQQNPFEGLDPTPDGLDNSCDLRVENFSEFHPSRGDADLMGDSYEDALWIVPEQNAIRIEEIGAGGAGHVFADNLAKDVEQLAVAQNGVVYAYAFDDTNGTVFVLHDTDRDGDADYSNSFTVGQEIGYSPIIDAVLVDVSGRDYGDQALVTLHEVDGSECLVINVDSDEDGYIEGSSESATPYCYVTEGQRLDSPRALAVDGRTGRIFVSGFISSQPVVVFYRDLDGDKLIDPDTDPQNPDSSALYFSDSQISGTDEEYPGIQYLTDEKTLLVLALKSGISEASIICVKDPEDDVFVWDEACRSLYFAYESGMGDEGKPKYIRGYAFTYSSSSYIRADVTLADRWTTYMLEMPNTENNCCFENSDVEMASIAESALRESNQLRLNLCAVTINTRDFVNKLCQNWFSTTVQGPCSSQNDSNNEKRYVWGIMDKNCKNKPEKSEVIMGPDGQGDVVQYHWTWSDPGNTQIWVETDVTWGVNTIGGCGCSETENLLETEWTFTGQVNDWNGAKWFDLFWNHNNRIQVKLQEKYQLPICPLWSGDPSAGTWNKNNMNLMKAANVPAETDFHLGLELNIEVDRSNGGAGGHEHPRIRVLFRPRCK